MDKKIVLPKFEWLRCGDNWIAGRSILIPAPDVDLFYAELEKSQNEGK